MLDMNSYDESELCEVSHWLRLLHKCFRLNRQRPSIKRRQTELRDSQSSAYPDMQRLRAEHERFRMRARREMIDFLSLSRGFSHELLSEN